LFCILVEAGAEQTAFELSTKNNLRGEGRGKERKERRGEEREELEHKRGRRSIPVSHDAPIE